MDPEFCNRMDTQNTQYSSEEQAVVDELIQVLEAFQNATTTVSDDTIPTLSLVIPILINLETVLPNDEKTSHHHQTIKEGYVWQHGEAH